LPSLTVGGTWLYTPGTHAVLGLDVGALRDELAYLLHVTAICGTKKLFVHGLKLRAITTSGNLLLRLLKTGASAPELVQVCHTHARALHAFPRGCFAVSAASSFWNETRPTRLSARSMGKNANASRAPRPDDDAGAPAAPGAAATTDGTVDGSFHSPAFLAAHVQRLQSTERVTWEDFKTKQMADARKAALEAAQEEAATLEFRRQLDRDREKRLAKARKDEKKSKSRKRRSRSRSRSPGRKHKSKKERSERKHKKSHKRRSRSRSSGDESSSSDSEDSTEKFRLSRWAAKDKD